MRIGILIDRLRRDEKKLAQAITHLGHEPVFIKIDDLLFALEKKPLDIDVVLERGIHHAKAWYALEIMQAYGIKTINSASCAETCGSKFLVSQALIKNNIPTPKTMVAFDKESALVACEKLGYPVIFKPPIGTWGKLCSKINDRDAAEAIIDHKQSLGSYHHAVFYIQKYIPKTEDYRVFVIGNKVVAALKREGEHWITHMDYDATVTTYQPDPSMIETALQASNAVGGDIVAVDMIKTTAGYVVIEVDYTVEFSKYKHLLPKNMALQMVKITCA